VQTDKKQHYVQSHEMTVNQDINVINACLLKPRWTEI